MKNFYLSLPGNKTPLVEFLFWTLVAYALFTWFSIHIHTSITADTLWLCDAAGRLLSGEKMGESYYDPNPPLSVLLYVPPVLLSLTGWATVYQSVFFYVLLLLAGASFATYCILKFIPGLEATTILLITVTLIIFNTIVTSISFTERDQMIGMWLLPFVLTQIAITKKWPLPSTLKHATLLTGAVLILLKPHYGLFPALILLHRVVTQKRLNVWKDADFLYLACAVLSYAAILVIFFSDYLRVVLPDVINLYLHNESTFALMRGILWALVFLIGISTAAIINNKSWIIYFLFIAAFVNLIPFIVQMRGYSYHLFPALTFFWCGAAVLGKETLQKIMAPHYALIAMMLIIIVAALALSPARMHFPTHEQYKELPLAKFLESCEDPCPVFVLNDHIEIMHQTALYSHKPWASRFPSFWFIPGIFDTDNTSPEAFAAYRAKYGYMVAEDLARYKPKLVLIGSFKLKDETTFDFLNFFSAEEAFRREWAHYKKKDDFTMDQRVYFKGTSLDKPRPMVYQVFERKND